MSRVSAKAPALLHLLSAGNLVVGTGAFALTGLLQPLATSLDVGIASAGQTMTAYALATALLAPLLLLASGRLARVRALQIALALVCLGQLVCASADSLTTLLAGRVLMGAGGMFIPISAGIAVAVAPAGGQGKALAVTMLGSSLSYVIGLPLCTWLGLRYGWRLPVHMLTALALLMLLLITWRLPRTLNAPGARFTGMGTVLRNPEARRALCLTLASFSAIFTVFSYIAPVLQALNPMGADRLSLTLTVFGLAGVTGTLTGGWANDRFGPLPTTRIQLAVLWAMMLCMPLTSGHYGLMLLALMVWALGGFGMMPPTQSRLAAISAPHAPMLFSLNSSMLYCGTAIGAAVGGAASTLVGFAALSWVGLAFATLGAITLLGRTARA